MLTDATQARSHELMLKQDQTKIQSSEGMEAVQEAYQYLIQVIFCQKHLFLHPLTQNMTRVYSVNQFSCHILSVGIVDKLGIFVCF